MTDAHREPPRNRLYDDMAKALSAGGEQAARANYMLGQMTALDNVLDRLERSQRDAGRQDARENDLAKVGSEAARERDAARRDRDILRERERAGDARQTEAAAAAVKLIEIAETFLAFAESDALPKALRHRFDAKHHVKRLRAAVKAARPHFVDEIPF